MKPENTIESEVNYYGNKFNVKIKTAKGFNLYDENNKEYIDFLSGAGTLNYGHNNDYIKNRLLNFLKEDRPVHLLDMHTTIKDKFLETFNDVILKPRNMDYKVQFTSPSGTSANEAAIMLAKKYTGLNTVISFSGAFHGMTDMSLSVSDRVRAYVVNKDNIMLPYPTEENTKIILDILVTLVGTSAAVIIETIQGDGGVNCAPVSFMQELSKLCNKSDTFLIIDDIQIGCGRTGTFFSFDDMNIKPHIVTLSKSLSGYGLPLAVCLIDSKYDIWETGEITGTFRSNQMALLTATAALEYADETKLYPWVDKKYIYTLDYFKDCKNLSTFEVRGKGLMIGVVVGEELGKTIAVECFKRGLLIETCGKNNEVLKLLPALNMDFNTLQLGIDIIEETLEYLIKG